jgi:hypothetical protein
MIKIQVIHDDKIYETRICWKTEFNKGIDNMPHLSELAKYDFFQNDQHIGSATVCSNKFLCEKMLCYDHDLEMDLAYLALDHLEENNILAWEMCNWNFFIKYTELHKNNDE